MKYEVYLTRTDRRHETIDADSARQAVAQITAMMPGWAAHEVRHSKDLEPWESREILGTCECGYVLLGGDVVTYTEDCVLCASCAESAKASVKDGSDEVDCPNCYGGHQRPCHFCGDTGQVTRLENTKQPEHSGSPKVQFPA